MFSSKIVQHNYIVPIKSKVKSILFKCDASYFPYVEVMSNIRISFS